MCKPRPFMLEYKGALALPSPSSQLLQNWCDMYLLQFLSTALLLVSSCHSANVFPSSNPRYDDMEVLYTLAQGAGSPGFVTEIVPCGTAPFGLVDSGRQTVGEWIRTWVLLPRFILLRTTFTNGQA